MGIDIHVGAAEDGVALRRISDTPGNLIKELRLYPYFFPDVFQKDGQGKPTEESLSNWIKIRRALLRKPVDRLGYGGYLKLALQYPDFVEHVSNLCSEFRSFKANAAGGESLKAPIKVGILNCWGKWKAWINSFGAPQKFLVKRPDVIQVAGTNLLECLAGLPVEVEFLSFEDLATRGIPKDIHVIINDGDSETAWSGGRWWIDPKIAETVRAFIHNGGGFIGCRGPTAYPHQGRYFQLADVMGVEKEIGNTLQSSIVQAHIAPEHFITADLDGTADFGSLETFVYTCDPTTQILATHGLHILAAAKTYGQGRSVFLGGLPYNLDNSRLLHRAIFWSAHHESHFYKWLSENPNTDCAYYPKSGKCVVVNNSHETQETVLHQNNGETVNINLAPFASQWIDGLYY